MAGDSCTAELGSSQLRSLSPCSLLWESLFEEAPEHVLVHIQEVWHRPEANEPCWTQASSAEGLTSLSSHSAPLTPGSGNAAQTHLSRLCALPGLVGKTSSLLLGLGWIWKPLNHICITLSTCQTQTGWWANIKTTQLAVSMALLTQQGSHAYGKQRAIYNGLLSSMFVLKAIMSSQL